MTGIDRPFPVNDDAQLAKALEGIIARLKKDDSLRKASAGQQAGRMTVLTEQVEDADVAGVRLERILGGNDLSDINYLALGVLRARAVGRVVVREGGRVAGFGTGFLVAPGVLLTNQHVLETPAQVQGSSVQFRYERDIQGANLDPVEFAFRTDPAPIIDEELDMALVQVEPASTDGQPLDGFGWLRLNPTPGKAFVGEYLTIIQHPNGERKQVCVRENKLLKLDENSPFLWYQTDTVGGSSGSPVFNNSWDVVALHHSGVPKTKKVNGVDVWLAKDGSVWRPEMGDDAVDWIANEGVRVSSIVRFLAARFADHPLSKAVREAADAPLTESLPAGADPAAPGGIRYITDRNGYTRISLPIEIGIKLDVGGALKPRVPAALPAAARNGAKPLALPAAAPTEKVEIDQTNYDERNGYDPAFLGGGIVVPLPQVRPATPAKFGKVVKFAGNRTELKYYNYSVVMNADRKLAYFSVANIDPAQFKGKRDKGDTWYKDTRIDADDQTGREFYKKQKTFEIDRSKNPFDQGHLTRRKDLQWGADLEVAKRNGDESFHYTNCAPQHWQFNQDDSESGLWFRLEESAIETLSHGGRLCVVNGPVFDAPVCVPGPDGRLHLNLSGPRAKDPKFGGVKIPKLFFKLIAYRDGTKLKAKAFVVTQEDMLETVDRLHADEVSTLTDAEVRLYQVTVADLEDLTGLKFGIPAAADTPHEDELARVESGAPITDELFPV